MTTVHFADQRVFAATPSEVWAVISDPVALADLDDRLTLQSASGTPGSLGSEYVLVMRSGVVKIRTRTVVTASEPERLLSGECFIQGRKVGSQTGTLESVDERTLLVWSVESKSSVLLKRFAVKMGTKELTKWFDAVEREVAHRRT